MIDVIKLRYYIDYSLKADFNKIIEKKKFKFFFIITGKNSFYKSKADKFIKLPKNKNNTKNQIKEYLELLS
tara:strand:+ start:52 stop:264 length:213 start_codon:yes stop_codon:yes gene_type:complete